MAIVLGAAYVGQIDDLAVFDRTLSDAEVQQVFGLADGVRDFGSRTGLLFVASQLCQHAVIFQGAGVASFFPAAISCATAPHNICRCGFWAENR